MEKHTVTDSLVKEPNPESDPASAFSCQFAGNREGRSTCPNVQRVHKQPSLCLWETHDPVLQRISFKEKKGMYGNL